MDEEARRIIREALKTIPGNSRVAGFAYVFLAVLGRSFNFYQS